MFAFQPFEIKNLVLKNRLVMAPMCMYQSDDSGLVKPFHRVHYPTRAYGGVGLVLLEATAVEPRGRISVNDLGIWSDEHIAPLQSLVQAVHQAGAKVGIQLAHAGRKATVQNEAIVAPSAIAFSSQYTTPKELSVREIHQIVQAFQNGALRAKQAGFDVIEIHGAHGYLINQFLSPLSNQRGDDFGGPMEHRIRFLMMIIQAIRQVFDGVLFVRLSAEEYAKEGHHIEQTLEVVQAIQPFVDGIDVSSGGVVPVSMEVFPGYQVPYSAKIHQLGIPTIAGGLITTCEQIESILQHQQASLVFLGRELLRNPYFPMHMAKKNQLNEWIIKPYERGFK